MRNLLDSHSRSTVAPSKLHFKTWVPSSRRKLRSCQPNIRIMHDQLLALEAMDANVRASGLRCRGSTAMVARGCANSPWAVTKRNMVTPSKLHFKTWMPSYRRKFPDEHSGKVTRSAFVSHIGAGLKMLTRDTVLLHPPIHPCPQWKIRTLAIGRPFQQSVFDQGWVSARKIAATRCWFIKTMGADNIVTKPTVDAANSLRQSCCLHAGVSSSDSS